jgi:hypothetical protein
MEIKTIVTVIKSSHTQIYVVPHDFLYNSTEVHMDPPLEPQNIGQPSSESFNVSE